MRRYLPEGKAGAVCNLAAFTYLNIGNEIGNSFEDTIKKIHLKMEEMKDKYIGLDDFVFIPAVLKKFPYPLQKKIIKSMF